MWTITIVTQRRITITTQYPKFVFKWIVHFFKFCIKWITTSFASQRKPMFITTSEPMVNNKKFPSALSATITFSTIFGNNKIPHSFSVGSSVEGGPLSISGGNNSSLVLMIPFFVYCISTLPTYRGFAIKTMALIAKAIQTFFFQTFCTFLHNVNIRKTTNNAFCSQNNCPKNEYNALADAKWNKELYEFIINKRAYPFNYSLGTF